MYCPACGIALTQQTRYCNRCGVQLVAQKETDGLKRSEKRLDEYLDGLFWITVFGVALIFVGMVVMKKVGLSDLFILAYLGISSTAFLINFVLNLRAALSIRKTAQDLKAANQRETDQLDPAQPAALPPISVTEHTTRTFDPVYVKPKIEGN